MDDEEKVEMILAWAEDHSEFDPKFVEEMQEKLDEYGHLTDRQSESLNKIIERFNVRWV